MDEIKKDKRFSHVARDPRFLQMKASERKFQVDKRFKKMFTDDKFKVKYVVDKRGRPITATSSDNLKKFYDLNKEEEDEVEDEDEEVETKTKKVKLSEKTEEDEEESDEGDEDEETVDDVEEVLSSDDDDEDEEEPEIEEIPWNELDKDAPRSDNETNRLALCNVDWDRINSKDIFVLLNSFKPANGSILSVKIYPSEYGKQRMNDEMINGPKELMEMDTEYPEEEEEEEEAKVGQFEEEDEEGNNYDKRKLREYQFNRLKYYYAIIECNNVDTAKQIYNECDGMEYESSSNRLDLRFVPDEEKFEDTPRDVCDESPDPSEYKPNRFFTVALNQTKIHCTWDETPRERLNITMNNFKSMKDINSVSYKNILASSSSEDENDDDGKEDAKDEKKKIADQDEKSQDATENDEINKYKKLLNLDNNDDSDDEFLQISWDNDMDAKKKSKSSSKSKKNKNKNDADDKEKAELLLISTESGDHKKHFSYNEIVKKKLKNKRDNADEFKIDLKDPRFDAVYSNHLFNIDPSSQMFKKTDEMEKLVSEKIKRDVLQPPTQQQANDANNNVHSKADANKTDELSSLVNTIKNRTKFSQNKFKK